MRRRLDSAIVLFFIFCTIVSIVLFTIYLFDFVRMSSLDRCIYYVLLLGLFYCGLSYQINRFGAARRRAKHRPFAQSELSYLFGAAAPSVTILIPSYREERRVLMMTILSAALAQYSNRRIVVLVDDPPADQASLQQTQFTVLEVKRLLASPASALQLEQREWKRRFAANDFDSAREAERLAWSYKSAAQWLEHLAVRLEAEIAAEFEHVDRFVIDNVTLDLARVYRAHAEELSRTALDKSQVDLEYLRLGNLFCADITSFERKRFENLSHAPNKAMNLNAYIGLMGGRYDIRTMDGRQRIEPATGAEADVSMAESTYVLTLDADSVIRGSYILELAHILNTNPTFGVAQTPYLTFPDSISAVERIAGAMTDVQYLVHQGATYFDASYWVGANALIRFAALKDICREQEEAGKSCKIFIQDETVIEDTGSTIDLLNAGWSVYNHFTPLAFSATPADFGALAIQRKRWSNGGLIIFPMLLSQYLNNGGRLRRLLELALRSNYLLSPVIGNISVFVLMLWASVDGRTLAWTPLAMLPYFALYGRDLSQLGYRFRDVFAVCALNLILLPVGFAGITASNRQLVTGKKGSFSRTPKVSDRTFIPPYYFLFNVLMFLLMGRYVVAGLVSGEYVDALIPALNVSLYGYGLHRFIGVRDGIADLGLAMRSRLAAVWRRAVDALPGFGRGANGGRRFAYGRALASVTMFAVAALAPWPFGPVLVDGELTSGAFADQRREVPIDGLLRPGFTLEQSSLAAPAPHAAGLWPSGTAQSNPYPWSIGPFDRQDFLGSAR